MSYENPNQDTLYAQIKKADRMFRRIGGKWRSKKLRAIRKRGEQAYAKHCRQTAKAIDRGYVPF